MTYSPEQREPRLESWKEIAAYLNRDVRTAYRWEKTEGLPVHRHKHLKGGTVYAYPDELDAWLLKRKGVPEAPETGLPRRRIQAWLGLTAVLTASMLLVAVWWYPANSGTAPVAAVGMLRTVTTESPEALELYTRAVQMSVETIPVGTGLPRWRGVESLLDAALERDADFPSAKILLGWARWNQGNAAYLPLATEAFGLADSVGDTERHFIRGSYFSMTGDHEAALEEYAMLVRIAPDHYWGLNNLVVTMDRVGRNALTLEHRVRLADLNPDHFGFNRSAAEFLVRNGLADRAAPYRDRARNLASSMPSVARLTALTTYWGIDTAVAWWHWEQRDYGRAVDEADRLTEKLESLDGPDQVALARNLADLYIGLGQIDAALECLRLADPAWGGYFRLLALTGDGRADELINEAFPPNPDLSALVAFAMLQARRGNLDDADVWISEARSWLVERGSMSPQLLQDLEYRVIAGEAELAHARGGPHTVESEFEQAFGQATALDRGFQYFTAESLARIKLDHGDRAGAIEVLEAWTRLLPGQEMNMGAVVPFLQRNRLFLAELLEESDALRAASIRSDLRDMLAYADEDHVVAHALQLPN